MDRKKIIYICLVLIITVLGSVTYFSYTFFTHKSEQHGKLNIAVIDLKYTIESDELVDNKIIINKNSVKFLTVKLTSLNKIKSKYGLYYKTNNNDTKVYYEYDSNLPTGLIEKNNSVVLKLIIVNSSNNNDEIEFVANGGFETNELNKIEEANDINIGILAEQIGYTDTYNAGCNNVQCILDRIAKMVGD